MSKEVVILECTESTKERKYVSRYTATRNKKKSSKIIEKMKFNYFLRRHTLHREIK